MTREELKAHCERQIEMCETWAYGRGEKPSGKVYEEHKLILELLEQEPCEVAISRQAVLDLMADYDLSMGQVVKGIHALPLVTPQQKIGKWIRVDKNKLKCSECEVIHLIAQYPNGKIDWCPNCGTKMQEIAE